MELFMKIFAKAVRARRVVNVLLIILPILTLIILLYNYTKLKNTKSEIKNRTIVRKLPKNKDICKKMISILSKSEKNKSIKERMKKTKIVEVKEWTNNMYNVMSNRMIVGTRGQDFYRLHKIASECLKSFQKTGKLKYASCLKILQTICYTAFLIFGIGLDLFSNPYIIKTLLTVLFSIVLILEIIRYYNNVKIEEKAIKTAPVLVENYLSQIDKIDEDDKASILFTYQEVNDNLRIIAYTKPLFWVLIRILVIFIIL